MVLAAAPGRDPASDLVQFRAALGQAFGRARIRTLLADADFDGEWVREHIRSYGIRTLIPSERGRPSEKLPAGKWRRRMKWRLAKKNYGQRWQTETVNYTREWLVLHADNSLTGPEVRRIVARVIDRRGAPTRIRNDNGSEFMCAALTSWLTGVGAEPIPVAAASPWENGYIEAFRSRLRDEFS